MNILIKALKCSELQSRKFLVGMPIWNSMNLKMLKLNTLKYPPSFAFLSKLQFRTLMLWITQVLDSISYCLTFTNNRKNLQYWNSTLNKQKIPNTSMSFSNCIAACVQQYYCRFSPVLELWLQFSDCTPVRPFLSITGSPKLPCGLTPKSFK